MALRIIACTLLVFSGCIWSSGDLNLLQQAEELSRQKKYDEAIALYEKHMQRRLHYKERPEWENPYFYLLVIGDIQLGQGKLDDALSSYLTADEKKVDTYLVSDRIRAVAREYEKQGKLKDAIQLLSKFRDRDDLLFDSMLDRLARELTRLEDESKISQASGSSSSASQTK